MTREEALNILHNASVYHPDYLDALNMAIEALEQEPCEDAISRAEVLSHAKTDRGNGHEQPFDYVEVDVIKQLPPVTPQYTEAEIQKMQDLESAEIQKAYEIGKAEKPNKWIPVSERLPEEYGEYLITWTTSQSKRPFIAICECEISNIYNHDMNRFDVEWLLEDCIKVYPDVEVIAWMPLPEPYKASPTGQKGANE